MEYAYHVRTYVLNYSVCTIFEGGNDNHRITGPKKYVDNSVKKMGKFNKNLVKNQ